MKVGTAVSSQNQAHVVFLFSHQDCTSPKHPQNGHTTGIHLVQDTTILFFNIYQENTSSCYRDNCSTNFIAALFIIVISWKQSRCPSMDKEKNVVNLYNVILLCYLKNKIKDKWMALEEIMSVETKIKKKTWYIFTYINY